MAAAIVEYVSVPEDVTIGSADDLFGETVTVVTMPEGTTVQTSERLFDKNFRDVIISCYDGDKFEDVSVIQHHENGSVRCQ